MIKFFQIKLFALSALLTLLASLFDIFYPTISLIIAFFIYCFFVSTDGFKFFCVLISGFLFDGFFNFNFGTCNLIFLSLVFFDLTLKKFISIKKKQINYYFLLLIVLGQLIFLLLHPLSQNFIPYLLINSSLSIIYLILLIRYAK
ncbi:hypothetical protein VI34_04070 [Methylophilales bacterium MBRSG12]|uniref:Rod shape-determining protein MreD n=1 Tax=Methylophilales bacterium MBRS-H7 TaxID=1623450 RepID=A0A0H4JBN7_9PROT|nr:hypothetical protein UZ34_06255 [Methylophilales bacterium MBRSF5]AKO65897.1 hypothetical protein VI33_04070 [Methylophilales bacterium MBRS-H7]AKO67217.1 hypothetical protein VI34_04070 [Methylophilales bacterium MBRSG12]